MKCNLARLMFEKDSKLSNRKLSRQLDIPFRSLLTLYNSRDKSLTTRIDPITVDKLCAYFGCTVNDLFEPETVDLEEIAETVKNAPKKTVGRPRSKRKSASQGAKGVSGDDALPIAG